MKEGFSFAWRQKSHEGEVLHFPGKEGTGSPFFLGCSTALGLMGQILSVSLTIFHPFYLGLQPAAPLFSVDLYRPVPYFSGIPAPGNTGGGFYDRFCRALLLLPHFFAATR